MITIISGTPGSGKTALVVDMIIDEVRLGRKIFTYGIPKLLLNVLQVDNPHTWQDGTWLAIDHYDPATSKLKGIKSTWMPRGCPSSCPYLSSCDKIGVDRPDAGSLIIVDEAHTEFPQRSSSSKVPPYIEALTVHRHQGLDFWFLTQRPSFLDPFIRGLCSRHLHIALSAFSFTGSRVLLEWTEYQETVNRTSKLLANRRSYKPRPHVFPLYHSATIHTKLDQKMPTIMKTFILVAFIFCLIAGFAVMRAKSRIEALSQPAQVMPPSLPIQQAPAVPSAVAGGDGGQRSGQTSPADYAPPLPYSSPSSPSSPAPSVISACISSKTKCICYTKNGVAVFLPDSECRSAAQRPTDKFNFSNS
jgi:zona occludens toxin